LAEDAQAVLRTLVCTEKQVPTSDGRWFAARIMPYRTLENMIDGLAITFTDITVSRKLEISLRQTSEMIKTILGGISDAFFSLDNNMVVTHFNPAAQRLLNRPSAEVVGKHLFESFPQTSGSQFDKKYRQALKEKTFLSFEAQFESAPDTGWFDVRVYPYADGLSVLFGVKPKHSTATGTGLTRERTP
jgi:PAS domain-containing protein